MERTAIIVPPRDRAVAPPARVLATADLGETKSKILDAAFRRLVTDGYAALSVREIAKDAGVNHALINYHYRSKDQLVIEVLDAANRRLIERQKQMYRGGGGFAGKWSEARRFYESDLASGFVRVQAELWAASLSNRELRKKFMPRLLAWKKVVLEAVREAVVMAERHGVKLPPPFTAEVIACWISEFWLGMEMADLLDVKEEQVQHQSALDAVQWMLEALDARVAKAQSAKAQAPARKSTVSAKRSRR